METTANNKYKQFEGIIDWKNDNNKSEIRFKEKLNLNIFLLYLQIWMILHNKPLCGIVTLFRNWRTRCGNSLSGISSFVPTHCEPTEWCVWNNI